MEEGGYEIISGHQLKTPPVMIRNMDDDQEMIQMKGGNLQRESILPSERAFACKMELEAIKTMEKRRF